MDSLFAVENIFIDIEGSSLSDILNNIEGELKKKEFIKDNFIQSVLDREKIFPTGLEFEDYSIAIPHTDSDFVKKDGIAIIKPKNSIYFKDMATNSKDLEVKIILLLLINKNENQVKVLSNIIKKFSDKKFYKQILQQGDKKELLKIINTKEI